MVALLRMQIFKKIVNKKNKTVYSETAQKGQASEQKSKINYSVEAEKEKMKN